MPLVVILGLVLGFLGSAPVAQADDATTARQGLRGDYYLSDPTSHEFTDLKASVVDSSVNFPNLVPIYKQRTGQPEYTGVRWTGSLTVPAEGDYTFSAVGDNGFRLYLDDAVAIDHWVNDWDSEQTSKPVHLTAGAHPFRFDLFQGDGGAHIKLSWQGPGSAKQVIPASAFTLPEDFHPVSAAATVAASGEQLTADFGKTLTGTDLASHLTVTVDGAAVAVKSASVQGTSLVVVPAATVAKGAVVRLVNDGKGSLAIDGKPAGAFDIPVENGSGYTMETRWSKDVDANNPLPEYPRPQLVRKQWQNLNGPWQLDTLKGLDQQPDFTSDTLEKIVVPYPIESKLSGIGRHEDDFAYRRTFEVPQGWQIGADTQHLMLQFGAVDHEAWVFVNGKQVAHHVGGYAAFSADVTSALQTGANELVVKVHDDTGNYPRGKQDANPSGIWYTANSGIWQTVWMEPVSANAISEATITPDLDAKAFTVTAHTPSSTEVNVTISAGGKQVATAKGTSNSPLQLNIADPRLWSPDDPFLYDVAISTDDDAVTSYAGMRKIEIAKVGGQQRILLNGKQTFLLSTLDQGYWPDGVYTAPTDEALAWDVQETKDLGFNTIRKHIKVEPQRWYYHADKIGMLVWQDMPANNGGNADQATQDAFRAEFTSIIEQHRSTPSIIGWIPMNEGWGEWNKAATGELADMVKKLDPSRLVNAHSGVNCCNSHGDSGRGDVIDWHQYTGPAAPRPDANRAAMDGEHGGFSLSIPGHVWPGGSVNPYGEVATKAELTDKYVANTAALARPAQDYLSGSVYTQLTDVEGEVNGFWTYDRSEAKMDRAKVKAINDRIVALGSGSIPDSASGDLAGWELDEAKGATSKDVTGNGHTLTLNDGATWTAGKQGSALKVQDGANATAQVPELDTTGSYTVSAWVRLDQLPDNYASFVTADGASSASAFFLQYGRPVDGFAMSLADGPRAVAKVQPQLDTWYHLTGVHDAKAHTLKLYLNGKLAAQVDAPSSALTSGTVALGRGQWEGKNVDFLNGALDRVHLYGRVLTDAQIAELAADTPAPQPARVMSASAGTKQVNQPTYVWGQVANAPSGTSVMTQVQLSDGRWSTSQKGMTDASGNYTLPLTYGASTVGSYRWRVVAMVDGAAVVGPEFTLQRTPQITVSTAGSKPVNQYTSVWGTVRGVPSGTIVQTQALVNGSWSTSQTGTTNASGYYALALTYGANRVGPQQFRVVVRTAGGSYPSAPFTLVRTA